MDPINDNEKTCKYCNKYLYDLGMNDGNSSGVAWPKFLGMLS